MVEVAGGLTGKLQRLEELCREMLGDRRLIIASNRGPVEYSLDPNGELVANRGSGGMVTALLAASRFVPVTWIASAMTEGDRRAAQLAGGAVQLPDAQVYVHFVQVPRAVYQRFYYTFANPLLWFLQHFMWNTPRTPNIGRAVYEAWDDGYVRVNQAFAEAIVEAASGSAAPYVMLQDYHLYLAPADVRERLPEATILHFTHIPWPSPHYWGILPKFMRQSIHECMCASDIVGLQTRNDVRNFLHSCEAILDDAYIDYQRSCVTHNGRTTFVYAYPISIDSYGLLEFAETPEVQRYVESLRERVTGKLVVRVDRSEPSKNIIRGLRSWELILERYPEYRGETTLMQFLVPSRSELGVYQTYTDEVFETVDSINDQYATDDWQPVQVFYENNYAQAIAGMQLYDVLFVNPLLDGMNLVAKEGPLVNKGDGVMVLSEQAGAHEQLGEYALSICPTDLEGTQRALLEALTMPIEERRRREAALKRLVLEEDITFWLERQLRDLLTASRRAL
ncbi:MAG TPA: trehalose-6-phosphate synthase [Dehalococcoidia bacterium]|nr:trehalose-6-phosphate synthase [Dehalococcoidia bacterium]